jgi:hypothetical protein
VAFVDAHRDDVVEGRRLGVELICSVLQVAPSSYYAAKTRPPSPRARRDAELIPQLVTLWENNYRVYGARKLCKAARRAGLEGGRDQVARLMGRDRGRPTDEAGPHHAHRSGRGPASGPGRTPIPGRRAEPAVGHRPDLRPGPRPHHRRHPSVAALPRRTAALTGRLGETPAQPLARRHRPPDDPAQRMGHDPARRRRHPRRRGRCPVALRLTHPRTV